MIPLAIRRPHRRLRGQGPGGGDPSRHGGRVTKLVVSGATVTLVAAGMTAVGFRAQPAEAFGSLNIPLLGEHAEHEMITRAALACDASNPVDGCFSSASLDALAGDRGTWGGVAAPDYPIGPNPAAAHCDDADFVTLTGYGQSRAAATQAFQACVDLARQNLRQAVDLAGILVPASADPAGRVDQSQAAISGWDTCLFVPSAAGGAKCQILDRLGQILHATQDVHSHSNWDDQANPNVAISITNPPGLHKRSPVPWLDLNDSRPITQIAGGDDRFSTGCYEMAELLSFLPPSVCKNRTRHADLNKDSAVINPRTGAVSSPGTARGKVLTNEADAVFGAVQETRAQWGT